MTKSNAPRTYDRRGGGGGVHVIVTNPGPTADGRGGRATDLRPPGSIPVEIRYRPSSQPNFENRLTAIFFLSRDNSLALLQHVNADNGPPLKGIHYLWLISLLVFTIIVDF